MPKISTITVPEMFGGRWMFRDLNREAVVRLAKVLKEKRDVDYLEVYVAAYEGTEKFAIYFRAIGHQRQYVRKVSGGFIQAFGENNVHWDISSPITVII